MLSKLIEIITILLMSSLLLFLIFSWALTDLDTTNVICHNSFCLKGVII